ncbi:MAG: hypothetical protein ACFFCW_33140 [Candidatus Hodarchaeota archaeon]
MDSNVIIKVGHFEADGDAYDLILGFVPDYIRLYNAGAAAGEVIVHEWFKDDASGKGFVTRRLTDNGTTATDTMEYLASGHAISKKETVTVQTTDPIKILGKVGVTIAAAWMDDSEEIYYFAVKCSEFNDIGDVA